MTRFDTMRARFQAADASFNDDGVEPGEGEALLGGVLHFVAGYLLGAELYQGAAAVRRAIDRAGLPPASLLESLMEPADVH